MHELALCGAIADIVTDRAAGRRVEVVRLRVGQFRQVVPDTLAYCWELVVQSTSLEGSVLAIDHVPARVGCPECGAEHELGDELDFACPDCGRPATTVLAGEEFLVSSIDVHSTVAS